MVPLSALVAGVTPQFGIVESLVRVLHQSEDDAESDLVLVLSAGVK